MSALIIWIAAPKCEAPNPLGNLKESPLFNLRVSALSETLERTLLYTPDGARLNSRAKLLSYCFRAR